MRGAERREILLDFSLTDLNLVNNYRTLKIDAAKADALVLSHGHMDHYGAPPRAGPAEQGMFKPGLALYAGGEDTFCHRVVATPSGTIDQGQLDRPALEARGLKIVLARQPTVVTGPRDDDGADSALDGLREATGGGAAHGRRRSTPRARPSTSVRRQVEVKPGGLVPDTFQGEHATVYHVKDRGLVVITSCGHAGVINSVRQAQKVTGIDKVHAVVGGFHLAPAPDEIVAKTVEAFRAIDPDYVIPMHCTGLNTIIALHREMPKKLVMPSTGTRVVFGGVSERPAVVLLSGGAGLGHRARDRPA